MKVAISKMWKGHRPGAKSDAVAFFDASVGDFRLLGCSLRRRHDNGSYFAATPGRGNGQHAICLAYDSPIREELCTSMLELYEASL